MSKISKVTLFSTAWCPYCKQEEEWLKENGVEFKTVMIDEDANAASYIVQKTNQNSIPITEVLYEDGDAKYIIGFDRSKLNAALSL